VDASKVDIALASPKDDAESSGLGVFEEDLHRLGERRECTESMDCCNDYSLRKGCTDIELAVACKGGSRRAGRDLYQTYQPGILSLMMQMTRNPEDASDLVQDAFVRVLTRIGDYRGESALGTWIYRVAVNLVIQHLRAKRRYERITGSIAEDSRHFQPETHDPTESLSVQEALDRLPQRMRRLVVLRYQHGFDYSEIAEMLGIKQGTVASGLNRAKQQLRKVLQ
jgi:RNA polymerase sigma factor (sigma-70 family)